MLPLYEFVNDALGIRVDVPFPVNERPEVITLTRRQVPSRVTVGVGAKPETLNDKLRKGYKVREERGDFQGKQAPGRLTTKQIEKALAMPDTD